MIKHYHFTALCILSGTTWVSRYQKGKPIWISCSKRPVSGSGISWAICKSAPRPRLITMPAPHHSSFFVRMDALHADNQQRQSTEDCALLLVTFANYDIWWYFHRIIHVFQWKLRVWFIYVTNGTLKTFLQAYKSSFLAVQWRMDKIL